MKLVIYSLTYKGREAQQAAVTEAIDIAEKIGDEKIQHMALSGIFVFADKIITEADVERVIRRIDMTKLGRYYLEREEKAVAEAVAEAKKEAKIEAKKEKQESAIKFLKTGDPIEKVAKCLSMPIKEVQALAAQI